jgi:hypothetical protein
VGFERRRDGTCNLLVYDPIFRPSPGIKAIADRGGRGNRRYTKGAELLKAHRRSDRALGRYPAFELLMLNPSLEAYGTGGGDADGSNIDSSTNEGKGKGKGKGAFEI